MLYHILIFFFFFFFLAIVVNDYDMTDSWDVEIGTMNIFNKVPDNQFLQN